MSTPPLRSGSPEGQDAVADWTALPAAVPRSVLASDTTVATAPWAHRAKTVVVGMKPSEGPPALELMLKAPHEVGSVVPAATGLPNPSDG
jgi:hypothetical protein